MDRQGALIVPLAEPASPLRLQGHNMKLHKHCKPHILRIASHKTEILFIICRI